jgi:hypothetical protein
MTSMQGVQRLLNSFFLQAVTSPPPFSPPPARIKIADKIAFHVISPTQFAYCSVSESQLSNSKALSSAHCFQITLGTAPYNVGECTRRGQAPFYCFTEYYLPSERRRGMIQRRLEHVGMQPHPPPPAHTNVLGVVLSGCNLSETDVYVCVYVLQTTLSLPSSYLRHMVPQTYVTFTLSQSTPSLSVKMV